ncbi:MAG: hypothetical protein EBX52_11905, partial [Proteobacteria bacterium]|nr:hypothetical protein [Pseudomonadota bacterium]
PPLNDSKSRKITRDVECKKRSLAGSVIRVMKARGLKTRTSPSRVLQENHTFPLSTLLSQADIPPRIQTIIPDLVIFPEHFEPSMKSLPVKNWQPGHFSARKGPNYAKRSLSEFAFDFTSKPA